MDTLYYLRVKSGFKSCYVPSLDLKKLGVKCSQQLPFFPSSPRGDIGLEDYILEGDEEEEEKEEEEEECIVLVKSPSFASLGIDFFAT